MTLQYLATAPLQGKFISAGHSPMRRVIDETAKATGLTAEQIIRKDNTRVPSRARQMAMLICHYYVKASYPEIGRVFQRDHTTVMYNVNRASEVMADYDWDDMEAIAKRAGVMK